MDKITKTVSGNSNLQIDNDNGEGLKIEWMMFRGTDYTDSGVSLNAWAAYATGTRTPDQTSTWYTTNDATFELTGVQLEVGNSASDFAHESFHETLSKCQRYYAIFAASRHNSSGDIEIEFLPFNFRATPTATRLSGVYFGGESSTGVSSIQTLTTGQSTNILTCMLVLKNSSDANCGGKYAMNAEL